MFETKTNRISSKPGISKPNLFFSPLIRQLARKKNKKYCTECTCESCECQSCKQHSSLFDLEQSSLLYESAQPCSCCTCSQENTDLIPFTKYNPEWSYNSGIHDTECYPTYTTEFPAPSDPYVENERDENSTVEPVNDPEEIIEDKKTEINTPPLINEPKPGIADPETKDSNKENETREPSTAEEQSFFSDPGNVLQQPEDQPGSGENAGYQPAVSTKEPVIVGSTQEDIEVWKEHITTDVQTMPQPDLSGNESSIHSMTDQGESMVKKKRRSRKNNAKNLESNVTKPPEVEEQPMFEPFEDPLVDPALKYIANLCKVPIPDQVLPEPVPTPMNTMPVMGDSLEAILKEQQDALDKADRERQEAMGILLPESPPLLEETPGQEAVMVLKDKQAEEEYLRDKEIQKQKEKLILHSEPPEPPMVLPEEVRENISAVVSNILVDPGKEASRIIEAIRIEAYGGQLKEMYQGLTAKPLLPEITTDIDTELRLIAGQAGISGEALENKIADTKIKLEQEQFQQCMLMDTSYQQNVSMLQEEGQEEFNLVTSAKETMDEHAQELVEAASFGEDPAIMRDKRDKTIRHVNEVTAQQRVVLEKAKTERKQQIEAGFVTLEKAYQAAVVRDMRTIETTLAGEENKEEKDLRTMELSQWRVRQYKELTATKQVLLAFIDGYVNAFKLIIESAADGAIQIINEWCVSKIGETEGWWNVLEQQHFNWQAREEAESAAWEADRLNTEKNKVIVDFYVLNQLKEKYGDKLDQVTIDKMQGLSQQHKDMLNAYYQKAKDNPKIATPTLPPQPEGKQKKPSRKEEIEQQKEADRIAGLNKEIDTSNSIAGVVAAMQGRLKDKYVEKLMKYFEEQVMDIKTTPDDQWWRLEVLAKTFHNEFDAGKTANKLYSAMHGGIRRFSTDEDAIYDALGRLATAFEIFIVRKAYYTIDGDTLQEDLEDELSTSEEDRAIALLHSDRALADAAIIEEAMHGGVFRYVKAGTDEESIKSTLRGKTKEEREAIYVAYEKKYHVDLRSALEDEMGGLDMEQTNALLEGDLAKADAIALRIAMDGWGTGESAITGTYEQIVKEVKQEAEANHWSTEQINAEINLRNSEVEAKYNIRSNGNWVPGARSALKSDFDDEMSGADLDLAKAMADNDPVKADAARIAIEAQGLYTSDTAVNAILRKQYERALEDVRRDRLPSLMQALDERERRDSKPWNKYKRDEEIRKLERMLEEEAKSGAMDNMNALHSVYDSKYNYFGLSSLASVVENNMDGNERNKARKLVEQGGYLSPVQQIHYAVTGPGTDEAALKEATRGRSKQEMDEIRKEWSKMHPHETLDERIDSETSGRDLFDLNMQLEGEPENAEQELDQQVRRAQWEFDNSSIGGGGRNLLQLRINQMKEDHDIMIDPDASPERKKLATERFNFHSKDVANAVEVYREQVDSVSDGIATVVSIAAAVVATAIVTFLTAGTATPAMIALMSSVAASVAATASQIIVKRIAKGDAYGGEDIGIDIAVGLVDVLANIATAGIGSKLLSAARGGVLFRMTQSPRMFTQMMGKFIAARTETLLSSLPSALAGNVLNDQNWENGNPFSNIVSGTLLQTGISMGVDVGMHPVSKVASSVIGPIGRVVGPLVPTRLRSVLGNVLDKITGRNIGASAHGPREFNAPGILHDVESVGPRVVRNSPNEAGLVPTENLFHADPALRDAMPPRLRKEVQVYVDPKLEANTVEIHYQVDADGYITGVHMRVGMEASPIDIRNHIEVVQTLKEYSGLSGRLLKLQKKIHRFFGVFGEPPIGTVAWEAQLEIGKLTTIIRNNTERLASGKLSPLEREIAEAQIEHLASQLKTHQENFRNLELSPGNGYIAAEGKIRTEKDLEVVKDRSDRNAEVAILIQKGKAPPPKFPPPVGHDYYFHNGEWEIRMRGDVPDGTPRYRLSADKTKFEPRPERVDFEGKKEDSLIDYPPPKKGEPMSAFERELQSRSDGTNSTSSSTMLTQEDAAMLRKWEDSVQKLRSKLQGKERTELFDDLFDDLERNYTEHSFSKFRQKVRSKILKHIEGLDASEQRGILNEFLKSMPDNGSKGALFSEYRTMLTGGDSVRNFTNIEGANTNIPKMGRNADGAIEVSQISKTRIEKGWPPDGKYLVEDKAGRDAFRLDQAKDYSKAIGSGKLKNAGGKYDGVVYVFENMDAAVAAAKSMDKTKGFSKKVYILCVNAEGQMVPVKRGI